MEVISRHCINPNLRFYQYNTNLQQDDCIDYERFCSMIDYWKVMLVDKFGAKRGQKVLIDTIMLNAYYYSAVFAVAELGMILIIDMPYAYDDSYLTDYKTNMHGKIDIIITQRHKFSNGQAQFEMSKYQHLSDNIIFDDEFDTYEIKDHSLYDQVAKTIFCRPEDDLIWSHTSGTTGLPKRAPDFHRKIYQTSKRISEYLDMRSNQSVLHTRGLHHGSSFCLYLMPTLMECQNHHSYTIQDLDDVEDMVKVVEDQKINRVFLYTSDYANKFLEIIDPIDHQLDILKMFAISPYNLELMKEKNINSMTTMFGDMVVGHAMFIKTVPKETDLSTYDTVDFGFPPDDFYHYRLDENGQLWVSCPSMGIDWGTSGDIFECIDGRWRFLGRGNTYRINGEWIKLADVDQKLRSLFGDDGASVVVDAEYERLYLAIWKENPDGERQFREFIRTQYKSINIDLTVRDQKYDHYFVGRKIDPQRLRQHCRKVILQQDNQSQTA